MLLSIVECGNHKLYQSSRADEPIEVFRLSSEIEKIGPVLGPSISHMRNWGAQKASGEWVFFKDLDCDLNPKNIIDLIYRIKKNNLPYVAVSGTYRNTATSVWAQSYGQIQRRWVHRGLKVGRGLRPADHLLGGALLVQRKSFLSVNGFNESIGWGSEEVDLVNRLQQKGYHTAVSFNLKVNHHNRLVLKGFLNRAWRQNFNRIYFQEQSITDKSQQRGRKRDYFKTPSPTLLSTGLFFATGLVAEKGAQILRRLEGKVN